jgi:UDPglucose 6-dehydrogenase
MKKTRISIIGAGYVGLCTAVGFATKGYNVTISDVDKEKIAKISKGEPPFHEPVLQEKLAESLQKGHLRCLRNQTGEAVSETDVTFVSVGTPSLPDGSIDLKFIEAAASDIGEALEKKESYHVTVIKSTVVPGTTQDVVKPILEEASGKKCGADFGLCMTPEFLRQGSAFQDTVHADRIVIGSWNQKSGDAIENLYREVYGETMPPLIRTTLATAELIKYASNSLLATKISFINMIAQICEKIPGADVTVVAKGMGLDKRIGAAFLDAGLGYGGSCFPKDTKALIANAKKLGCKPLLLEATEKINQAQPIKAVELCKEQLGCLKGKRVAILGLAFKPDTDDMREARVVPIVNRLLEEGAEVAAYDPVAVTVAQKIFGNKISCSMSAVECLKGADGCILVTEWQEFKKLKPADFIKLMRQPNLVDGRRIYNPTEFQKKMKFSAIGFGE